MITIVILAKDEEQNLPVCLDSVREVSDDVHLVDSGSTDRTVEIAQKLGVHVHSHAFESFGRQRNWAIDSVPHRYEWVFHLDADERFTPALSKEIASIVARRPQQAGFLVPSKLMLGGTWLRYSGEYPAYQLRLFHKNRLRFVDAGHGQREEAQGDVGRIEEPYLHFAFSKGLEHWLQKHAHYARQEACAVRRDRSSAFGDLWSLLTVEASERRRALKQLSFRLPARGLLRMFHLLIVKRGLLDGRPGIVHARMKSMYEEMASLYLMADGIVDLQLRDAPTD